MPPNAMTFRASLPAGTTIIPVAGGMHWRVAARQVGLFTANTRLSSTNLPAISPSFVRTVIDANDQGITVASVLQHGIEAGMPFATVFRRGTTGQAYTLDDHVLSKLKWHQVGRGLSLSPAGEEISIAMQLSREQQLEWSTRPADGRVPFIPRPSLARVEGARLNPTVSADCQHGGYRISYTSSAVLGPDTYRSFVVSAYAWYMTQQISFDPLRIPPASTKMFCGWSTEPNCDVAEDWLLFSGLRYHMDMAPTSILVSSPDVNNDNRWWYFINDRWVHGIQQGELRFQATQGQAMTRSRAERDARSESLTDALGSTYRPASRRQRNRSAFAERFSRDVVRLADYVADNNTDVENETEELGFAAPAEEVENVVEEVKEAPPQTFKRVIDI